MACDAEQRTVDSLQAHIDGLAEREASTQEICNDPSPRVNRQCSARQAADAENRSNLESQMQDAEAALVACQSA